MKKVGIIAGNGRLPFIASAAARQRGHEVFVGAIKGEAAEEIGFSATEIAWVKLGELKKLAHFFKQHSVENICFEGKITKTNIFSGHIKPDVDMMLLFMRLKNKQDDTILSALCNYFEGKGIHVLHSTSFLEDCLPGRGCLTKKKPTKSQNEDIQFGWSLAKESARLDIGQSVVVKEKAVLAIEAIEGTDEAIKRGGTLGHGGVVVVKVAKPNQDMRFDVPTIGPMTIQSLIQAQASVLAFEAGKTILVEQDTVVTMANKNGIVLMGV
ncbi:MAG: UDP-2,3-diacylglucosamine diphosphatase LpxI [Candidatus Omnitrophica bacterium]|nr:UDP-2,3-diacylglucosamine diphosphatase LpxI [Candidatus Omnitrophota bacterium]